MTLLGEGVVVLELPVSSTSTMRLADTEGQEEIGKQQHCSSSSTLNSSKTTSVFPSLGLFVVVTGLNQSAKCVGANIVIIKTTSSPRVRRFTTTIMFAENTVFPVSLAC